ncbi:hypothetical protein SUDANB121_00377 [Nocardiopsis dassonvillei]|uniref:hypothetical protein n=1 Tax=Nocardiopsis dassonvillei TaxID=2014 RepID=UPI003F56DB40
MHFTSEQRLDDDLLERAFTLDGIPGVLWTPRSASASAPAPLVLLGHPGGPVGYSGGIISLGIRLAAVDPRIAAAVLFAGTFVPRSMFDDARRITVPLHVLLQWDDEHNDRRLALDLFDALGSGEKTLNADMGGHTGVPRSAGEEAARFLARHLR